MSTKFGVTKNVGLVKNVFNVVCRMVFLIVVQCVCARACVWCVCVCVYVCVVCMCGVCVCVCVVCMCGVCVYVCVCMYVCSVWTFVCELSRQRIEFFSAVINRL
jgi:hypothetical protein